jgi:hypothetical protein
MVLIESETNGIIIPLGSKECTNITARALVALSIPVTSVYVIEMEPRPMTDVQLYLIFMFIPTLIFLLLP